MLDGPGRPGKRVDHPVKPLEVGALLCLFPAELEQVEGPVLSTLESKVERKDEARDGSPPRRGHNG